MWDRFRRDPWLGVHCVGDKALESVDIDGIVYLAPIAGILASVVADTTTDAGERVIFFNDA
jgi:hypothetical protein